MNAKAREQAGPLFADQVEQTTATEQYWRWRKVKAMAPGGYQGAELERVNWRWDLYVLRRIARQVMTPEDFATADARRWKGPELPFWRDVLLGRRRMVLDYERISHGYRPLLNADGTPFVILAGPDKGQHVLIERVELRERMLWPPAGWTPPLTEAELKELLATTPALEHPSAVDPLGLK
jgi:hypothetical protein